ncbi:pyridoxal phosphate-dependent aminotransferase [Puteibacter caeruleilacunae]|nr:pyridoxal phosphate-dependent aminotransferase [Puteibacter caeruleilacunae]
MEKVADRIARLSVSQTLAMAQKSRELKAEGYPIISLSIGEPDFDTPDFIKEAAKKAIDDNFSHYPPLAGYPVLREAIVNKLKRDNNLDYSPDQICVSNGAKHSLANVIQSVVNPGDEVIIPAPYWVTYIELVKLSEGESVIIETSVDTDFKITPEQLEAAITPKTRAFLFNSPNNPTGNVYTKEELKAIADVLAKYPNIIIIADEIYEYIVYKHAHESIAQFEAIKDRVVIINGVSKAFAMTGYRVGYIAAPLWITKAVNKLQGQFTSGVNAVAQMAAATAIQSDNCEVKKMVEQFAKRRNMVLELLKDIPGFKTSIPDGAFYVFPDVSWYYGKSDGKVTINSAADLSMYLLNDCYVACVSGEGFGAPDCIRFSYAASEAELQEAFARVKESLAKLK